MSYLVPRDYWESRKKFIVYNDTGEEIPNEEVKRGDNLTYIITVKNSTQTASRNTDIQMIDSFDTERVDVELEAMKKSTVGSISTPSTDTYSPIESSAYDTTSGKMTVDGGTLEQDQYIRFRVKVKVKINAKSGDLLNTAEATSGTKKKQ